MAKVKERKAKPPKSLMREFRDLLSEAPLDFMGTGTNAEAQQAQRDFDALVSQFEKRLAAFARERNKLKRQVELAKSTAWIHYDELADTYVCTFCGQTSRNERDLKHHPECPDQLVS